MVWRIALCLAGPMAACSAAPVDTEMAEAVRTAGVNQIGLGNVSAVDWLELAEEGCARGAWEDDVAIELGRRFVNRHNPEGVYSDLEVGQAVWIVTVTLCRESFSPEELSEGPPGQRGP